MINRGTWGVMSSNNLYSVVGCVILSCNTPERETPCVQASLQLFTQQPYVLHWRGSVYVTQIYSPCSNLNVPFVAVPCYFVNSQKHLFRGPWPTRNLLADNNEMNNNEEEGWGFSEKSIDQSNASAQTFFCLLSSNGSNTWVMYSVFHDPRRFCSGNLKAAAKKPTSVGQTVLKDHPPVISMLFLLSSFSNLILC